MVNFYRLAVYQILLRIGWIFKTESIIMPAFMDLIGGAAWQRGCLPMLNRIGQSIPPLLASDRVRNLTHKRACLLLTSLSMGGCFLILAMAWWITVSDHRSPNSQSASLEFNSWWWPWLFLLVYGVFFAATGVNQLVFNTLIGKLISTDRRGRLAAVGSLAGGLSAIVVGWIWLKPWMEAKPPLFVWIFGFTGVMFIVAGLLACLLVEPADQGRQTLRSGFEIITHARLTVAGDANFRLLVVAGAMFGLSMTLFPHYQSIAREKLNIEYQTMFYWIVAQHFGASLISLPAGALADRFGNRKVLRILMGALCIAPVILLTAQLFETPWQLPYLVIFFLLGLTPLTVRFFNNYALEVTNRENHPAYLSTLSLCIATPVIAFSTAIGALIDMIGLEIIFTVVLTFILAGWAITFWLDEPRHGARQAEE